MIFAASSFTLHSFTTTRLRLSLRSLDDAEAKPRHLGNVPYSACASYRPLSAPGYSESADEETPDSNYDVTTPSDS
jgi:hypothetical protein